MMISANKTWANVALHVTVLLWGMTAILGKLISYGSLNLVWHRMSITFIVFCLCPGTISNIRKMAWSQISAFLWIGMLLCIHWLSFYLSIKLGDSASITLACLGSASFFSAFCEPFIINSPFSVKDLSLGVVALIGILFIYISLPSGSSTAPGVNYSGAVAVGLFASLLGSIYTILNKKYIQDIPHNAASAIQMFAGSGLLTVCLPVVHHYVSSEPIIWHPRLDIGHLTISTMRSGEWDFIWVIILAVGCTNLTYYLWMFSLSHLSAFTVNNTGNMEPVYGIALGAIFFHENQSLNNSFYIGTSIILGCIFFDVIMDGVKYCLPSFVPNKQ
jgi:drug/metabolite transporter (DMT)-like permease